ncbi:MAG TPA: hypothetical protein VI643_05110 [Planctomycetota bacterium]|nr:hypothetical protein [Planctomycetota bacterium]
MVNRGLRAALVAGLMSALPAALLAQEPVKIVIEIENLSKEQGDQLRSGVAGIASVAEVSVAGSKLTVSVKAEKALKLSEIEKILAGLKQEGDKKLKILIDKIRLTGKVEITCEGDEMKLHGALTKVSKLKDIQGKGGGCFACTADKGGIAVADIVKSLAKAGKDESAGTVIDVLWQGPPKQEAKPDPGKKPGG